MSASRTSSSGTGDTSKYKNLVDKKRDDLCGVVFFARVGAGMSEQNFAGHVTPPVDLAVDDDGVLVAALRERAVVRDCRRDVADEFLQTSLIALVDVVFVQLERERDIAAVEEHDRAVGRVEKRTARWFAPQGFWPSRR